MTVSYNPNIPIVIVHPFYEYETHPFFAQKSNKKDKVLELFWRTDTYLKNIIDLITNHPRELIFLETLEKLAHTRALTNSLRNKPFDFISTTPDHPEPTKGWKELFDKINSLNAHKIGLAGGYYLGEGYGCLGYTQKMLNGQNINAEILEGHYFSDI